ncbi:hypothetical protein GGTG_10388 [Gaeumannomyces tritici R3-111a-1]|uniref:Cyanovirin-N domain-containing protein n=1 Tax=Gaeumannomyces tritici (strain R3-111a-1) TaxID=644352 RepID=J3PA62_GAET3|nr:hypothetical protein GGTG_10388 [Gaeumannomyces tritici R3-111a-1]EJT71128.1 hypothetical protein GGTG_10388 [Gaeumannomyces tritici R3-111a-1]
MELWTLLLGALVALPAAALKGDFLASCYDVNVGSANPPGVPVFNDFVSATCQTMNSKSQATSMDLNLCVGFDVSTQTLAWSPMGKFRNYCRNCSLKAPSELQCTCGTDNRASSLDLNEGVSNRNGTLFCMSWA